MKQSGRILGETKNFYEIAGLFRSPTKTKASALCTCGKDVRQNAEHAEKKGKVHPNTEDDAYAKGRYALPFTVILTPAVVYILQELHVVDVQESMESGKTSADILEA